MLHLFYGMLIRRLQYPKNQVSKKIDISMHNYMAFSVQKIFHYFILPNISNTKIHHQSIITSSVTAYVFHGDSSRSFDSAGDRADSCGPITLPLFSVIVYFVNSSHCHVLSTNAALMTRGHKICLFPWLHQYHRPCRRDTWISIYLSLLMEKGACMWVGCKLDLESLEVLGLLLFRSWRTH